MYNSIIMTIQTEIDSLTKQESEILKWDGWSKLEFQAYIAGLKSAIRIIQDEENAFIEF